MQSLARSKELGHLPRYSLTIAFKFISLILPAQWNFNVAKHPYIANFGMEYEIRIGRPTFFSMHHT